MILSLRDEIKHVVLLCGLSDWWRSITCLSEMAQVLKSLVNDLYSYFFTVKIDHNYPNKMIDFNDRRLWNFYKHPKWPVLYDKCIGKSMVVCNLNYFVIDCQATRSMNRN